MRVHPRTVLLVALVTAVVAFCRVQDRFTASAARQYVDRQQAAVEGRGDPVTVDEIMRPAVRRSVEDASLWGAAVMGLGVVVAVVLRRVGA